MHKKNLLINVKAGLAPAPILIPYALAYQLLSPGVIF
jgi:hypothetical protein